MAGAFLASVLWALQLSGAVRPSTYRTQCVLPPATLVDAEPLCSLGSQIWSLYVGHMPTSWIMPSDQGRDGYCALAGEGLLRARTVPESVSIPAMEGGTDENGMPNHPGWPLTPLPGLSGPKEGRLSARAASTMLPIGSVSLQPWLCLRQPPEVGYLRLGPPVR